MFQIKNLNITINNNPILRNVNLDLQKGDIVAILGPNGQGKSSLLKAIMSHYSVELTSGDIIFNNENITTLNTYEKARKGIFLALQTPTEISGLSQINLYKSIIKNNNLNKEIKMLELFKIINSSLKTVHLSEDVLERSINENFSGGEKKKNEIMQMMLMNPEIIMLDEIDSGLDVDTTLNVIEILKNIDLKQKILMFVTHNEKLIQSLKPNKVILIANNEIVKQSDISLANEIIKNGYKNILKELNIKLHKPKKQLLKSCGGKQVA